ncbi:MAG: (d)CMP kinase [Bacteroidia bacterium]
MQKITIAIDGYSSCGKSTLAKALAQRLNYSYVDTGAMYRAVTLFAIRNNFIDKDHVLDEEGLINSLDQINVGFAFDSHTKTSQTILNGENVESYIRGMEVSGLVSRVSSIRAVREKMIALQRHMGKQKGVIMDGRDIGTNVFPKADLKIFMTADNDVRAQRRRDEYTSKGQYFTLEEVKKKLMQRDHEDSTRKENPLTKAKDAITLDNSDISREEQLDFVLKLIDDLHLLMKEREKEKERQKHH